MTIINNRPRTAQRIQYRISGRVLITLLGLLFSSTVAFAAPPVEVSPDKPAEYMIYQYPDVALLIRIDTAGIEFESRVFGPEQTLVMASGIPGRRMGPVYQLIEAVDEPRQLIVQVKPQETSERSRISMELVQLTGKDRNSNILLTAFRLLSRAGELTRANDTSTWAMKVYTLKQAAQAFTQLGWEELRLWSEYYAAHLIFFKLHDNLSAMEFAREVETAARKAGIRMVELAALQLEGAVLMESTAGGSSQKTGASFDNIHQIYQRVAQMADELGLQSERSRAIFNDGLTWERQENLGQALEQYKLALRIAQAEGNNELATLARKKAAYVYEKQGSISGALEILSQASDEAGDQLENLRRAESLFEKGRLLVEAGYFPQAVEALTQSLQLQRAAGSRSRDGAASLLLGQSYYGMGDMDQAETVLRGLVERTPASGNASLLGNAFNILAGIERFQGNAEPMARDRDQQAAFIVSAHGQAKFIFEQALDALRVYPTQTATASSLFKQSRQQAIKAGNRLLQHRSILYLCSLAPSVEAGGEQTCSQQAVRQSVDYLVSAGIPAFALEANWLGSKYLRIEGQLSQAIQQMAQLAEDMRFYRSVLPGVLGAWYWENREQVYRDYMSMVLKRAGVNQREFADGRQTLLALNSLRAIERPGGSATDLDGSDDSGQIRSLLAKNRQAPEHTVSAAELSEISEWLQLAGKRFVASETVLDMSGLDGLLKHMSEDSALLTYYFSANKAYVMVAGNDGVRLLELLVPGDIKSQLGEVRALLGKQVGFSLNLRLELFGKLLVAPIESLLPEVVYLMPTGPLSGFPFDLLRRKGQYLAAKYQVINILSPAVLDNPVVRFNSVDLKLFFLAGKPDIRRDIFDYEQKPSAEIQTIADIFVGPSLHIVQGSALGRDEFQDGRFEKADIIHLAIPGTIKLEFPERSRLMLSGTARRPISEFLGPADIRKNNFKARLVVLSGINFEGTDRFNLDPHPGFVSDFLTSGVPIVITSLWRIPDVERAQFFAEFYRNLENNPDIAAALSTSRRTFLTKNSSDDGYIRWGGFQLYLN